MILQQVTPTSWNIEDKGVIHGTVERVENGYRVKTGIRTEVIPSLTELVKDWDMSIREITGLPVKHPDYDLMPNTVPPMYVISRSEYAAGYWGIRTHTSWVMRYCPSIKVLQSSYEVIGPYATRSELKKEMVKKCI